MCSFYAIAIVERDALQTANAAEDENNLEPILDIGIISFKAILLETASCLYIRFAVIFLFCKSHFVLHSQLSFFGLSTSFFFCLPVLCAIYATWRLALEYCCCVSVFVL